MNDQDSKSKVSLGERETLWLIIKIEIIPLLMKFGEMEKNEKFLVIAGTLSGLYHPYIEKIWPKSKMTKLLFVFSFLPMIIVPSYTLTCIKYIIFENTSVARKMYAAAPASYTCFSAYLGWSFYFNKYRFLKVSELWNSFFQEDLFSENRQALLAHEIKVSMKVIKTVMSISVLSATFYSVSNYFSSDKTFSHPVGFSYRHQSPDFEIIATYEFLVLLFSFSTLVTYESMTMYLLTLEKAQFTHLKRSLGRIFEYIYVTKSGELVISKNTKIEEFESPYINDATRNVEKVLRVWIIQHQQILRFHKELQEIYYLPFSFKYIAFVIFIILAVSLNVMEGVFAFNERVLTVFFLINNYSLFYLNVRNADIIGETDNSIFDEAYDTGWYFYKKNLKSIVNTIIMKSHKPVNLVALKIYPLSSRTFFKILSLAYSFLTFFLHISKNIEM